MSEPELLRSAVHKTTSAIMTQKHAREIVQELHAAGYHISPVLFDPENEHLHSLLDEAIAALEPFEKEAAKQDLYRADDSDGVMIKVGLLRQASSVAAKLRAARNG
jgi:hypothetical protein